MNSRVASSGWIGRISKSVPVTQRHALFQPTPRIGINSEMAVASKPPQRRDLARPSAPPGIHRRRAVPPGKSPGSVAGGNLGQARASVEKRIMVVRASRLIAGTLP